jgi:hypothetical protein
VGTRALILQGVTVGEGAHCCCRERRDAQCAALHHCSGRSRAQDR